MHLHQGGGLEFMPLLGLPKALGPCMPKAVSDGLVGSRIIAFLRLVVAVCRVLVGFAMGFGNALYRYDPGHVVSFFRA